MSEEEKPAETQTPDPVEDGAKEAEEEADATSSEGETPSEDENNLVTKAEKAAQRLEVANKQMEKNIKRLEEFNAERALEGKSFAGGSSKKEEESPEEFANKFMESEKNILIPDEK